MKTKRHGAGLAPDPTRTEPSHKDRPSTRSPPALWPEWSDHLQALRPACARTRTFLWLSAALLGLCALGDRAGVTSWVRSGFLSGVAYRRLLHLFAGGGVRLEALTHSWVGLVLTLFQPLDVDGYRIAVTDGLKVPKEGHRMPGVKSLHQESPNNSKPPYIMGHSFQVVGLLAEGNPAPVCVPLASRLHEGVKSGPGEKRTLLDKLVALFLPLASELGGPALLLADAYYASRKIVLPLLAAGHHLVTRVRTNAVAYRLPTPPLRRRRGRPRIYGDKVRLNDLWRSPGFTTVQSPAYGEREVWLRLLALDLLWRPVGHRVRFVLVDHPVRGRLILMTTHLGLDPVEVVHLYSLRFKIEVSFKQAVHTVGTYAYHFWLKTMRPIHRGSGDQYLHRAAPAYRLRVRRKLAAYELHAQLGCIAQGLLQHFAVHHRTEVWKAFRSWMRTMHVEATPSEAVTAQALRAGLPDYLMTARPGGSFEKFLVDQVDWTRLPGVRMGT